MEPDSRRPTTASRESDPQRRQAKAGKIFRGERTLILGLFFSCLIFGVFFPEPVPGSAGAALAAMALGASVLWTVVASLALALDRAIRRADRGFFMRQDQTPGDGAGTDWDTRTGSFAWMRDWEDLQSGNDDHHP